MSTENVPGLEQTAENKPGLFHFSAVEKSAFLWGAAITILVRLQDIVQTSAWMIDNYAFVNYTIGPLYWKARRYTAFWLEEIMMHGIGVNAHQTVFLFAVLANLSLCLGGLLLARLWKINDSFWSTLVVILVVSLYPLHNDIMVYKPFYSAFLAFPLILLPLCFSRYSIDRFILGTLFVFLAIGIYQVFINAAGGAVLMAFAFGLVREMRDKPSVSWKSVLVREKIIPKIAVVFSGSFLYLIVDKLIASTKISNDFRASFIKDLPQLFERMTFLKKMTWTLFSPFSGDTNIHYDFLNPPIAKILFLLILCCTLFSLFVLAIRKTTDSRCFSRWIAALGVVVLMSLAVLVSSMGMQCFIVEKMWAGTPRQFMMAGVAIAGITGLMILLTENRRRCKAFGNGLVCTLFGVYALCCCAFFVVGMDFNAQLRVMTAAIYYDLEKLPEFRRDMRIHLIGDRPLLYGKKDRMSVVGNTFVGSAPYFNAVCGSRFLSVRQLPAETLNKYAALPVWPKSGAIVFDKETQTAIVKLGTIPVNYHNKVVKVVPGVGIELTWQLNEDAVSYQIFRWTKQNQSDIKGLATVSEPIYVDKDVQPGVTYHYNVRGQRENGEFFPWGKAVSATIPE